MTSHARVKFNYYYLKKNKKKNSNLEKIAKIYHALLLADQAFFESSTLFPVDDNANMSIVWNIYIFICW